MDSDNRRLFHYLGLERVMWIPASKFNALPVYNSSLPTGTVKGFRWKKLIQPHKDFPKIQQYRIGEFGDVAPDDDTQILIHWFRPIIIVGK